VRGERGEKREGQGEKKRESEGEWRVEQKNDSPQTRETPNGGQGREGGREQVRRVYLLLIRLPFFLIKMP